MSASRPPPSRAAWRHSLRDRPTRGFARTNLVWVFGIAAGVVVGAIVAYGLASTGSSPTAASTSN